MFSYEITSPTEARKGLFQLLNQVVENREVLIINRRRVRKCCFNRRV